MTRLTAAQRELMAEANDLQLKVDTLDHLIWSEAMMDLSCVQRRRLHRQLNAMQTYLDVLNERIKEFSDAD